MEQNSNPVCIHCVLMLLYYPDFHQCVQTCSPQKIFAVYFPINVPQTGNANEICCVITGSLKFDHNCSLMGKLSTQTVFPMT